MTYETARLEILTGKLAGRSMLECAKVPIVIVGYRNPDDIRQCLDALTHVRGSPTFAVLICENGGPAAFESLLAAVSGPDGPCHGGLEAVSAEPIVFVQARRSRLGPDGPVVILAEARENLGYAGAINAWITALKDNWEWDGLWVLNPDTQPAPDALVELVAYSERCNRGMVGSRMVFSDNPNFVSSRGLKWRRVLATTLGVGVGAPVSPAPDLNVIDARIDSPSGASFYITRCCVNRIGLMDERYFLYYEDLDWGLRAKAACGVGYAHSSVVRHKGGTTTGRTQSRAARSRMSVYLEFRNRLLFVRRHFPAWLTWTLAMSFFWAGRYLLVGAVGNFHTALHGLSAGFRGETGRPIIY
jgi:N-acetylglucosaminyl-diphospho-decaprenol L-rhamnosyltransferase